MIPALFTLAGVVLGASLNALMNEFDRRWLAERYICDHDRLATKLVAQELRDRGMGR
jgi:hypothetical protein